MKVIRPRILSYAVTGAAVISALALGSSIFTGTLKQSLSGLCLLGAFDVLVWLFFVEPRVVFDSESVEIRNPIRVFKATWSAVTGFETKYGLAVVTKERKFVAWSAPAPSRREAGRIRASELKGTSLQGEAIVEPGQLETSESGSVYGQLSSARAASTSKEQYVSIAINWFGILAIVFALLLTYLALHI